jgi:hypothetical protein
MKNPPVIFGGLSLIVGYLTAWAARKPSPVPAELRAFHRREQLDRLRRMARLRQSELRATAGL